MKNFQELCPHIGFSPAYLNGSFGRGQGSALYLVSGDGGVERFGLRARCVPDLLR